jgi:hypothetical protein
MRAAPFILIINFSKRTRPAEGALRSHELLIQSAIRLKIRRLFDGDVG